MHKDGTYNYKNVGIQAKAYHVSAVADFNADGIADILWENKNKHKIYIWYMHKDGTYNYKKIEESKVPVNIIKVGDFNGDGFADILSIIKNKKIIWYMKESGKYTKEVLKKIKKKRK